MSAEATDPAQDGSLSGQAVAYRKLAMNADPGTACGRNNDVPRDGITVAIPAGWILLPPDPSRPSKQLVAPDGEGWLVVM